MLVRMPLVRYLLLARDWVNGDRGLGRVDRGQRLVLTRSDANQRRLLRGPYTRNDHPGPAGVEQGGETKARTAIGEEDIRELGGIDDAYWTCEYILSDTWRCHVSGKGYKKRVEGVC